MKPLRNIEETIRTKLHARVDVTLHDRVLAEVRRAYQHNEPMTPAHREPVIRRSIMESPLTKVAIAAAVLVAVVLGLFEFIDTGSTSGVVWADVARKVQASQGVIFRAIQHTAPPSYDDEVDFSINHYSSTKARLDRYKSGQIVNTMYDNCTTKTVVLVDHIHKSYVQDTNAEDMPSSFQMADPNRIIQRFLGCEHRELGRTTIEGVLCEGIETTDPAFHGGENPPESLTARIWVGVETGYPVRIEAEYVREDGQRRFAYVQDQFQWDVELDESLFEPNVPAGYIDISPGEW